MDYVIGPILVFLALIVIYVAVVVLQDRHDQRALEADQRKSDEAYAEWAVTDQELRDWAYAALYERYEAPYRESTYGLSTLPQAGGWTTASSVFGEGGASGRPWNDVPIPQTTRILYPEVPGAD